MFWSSDYEDEIVKAQQYADHPGRFTPCANGWMLKVNHHRHYIRIVDGCIECSCGTFKRKALVGQPWCEHTRAVETLMATGKLKQPKSVTLSPSAPNDLVLFAPT